MPFKLLIETENDAFCDEEGDFDPGIARQSVAVMLVELANLLSAFDDKNGGVRDINGNTVGSWRLWKKRAPANG